MSDEFEMGGVAYELVEPFVVCTSVGGAYDDRSFCAGVAYGKLDRLLHMHPSEHTETVEPDLVPQLDLLAMRHGYSLTVAPWEDGDDYVFATFAPPIEGSHEE